MIVFLFYSALFGLVWFIAQSLSNPEDRKTVHGLLILGLLFSLVKIGLFQQTPQWLDINPDALTYEANARAFVQRWLGQDVDSKAFNLRGLLSIGQSVWSQQDFISYGEVIGPGRDWFFTFYVALWFWAAQASVTSIVYANAIFIAFLPVGGYGLVKLWTQSNKLAWIAAGLLLLETSTAVNGIWLMKDSLVTFFATATVWGICLLGKKPDKKVLFVTICMLTLLGLSRYVAYASLLIALGCWCLWLIMTGETKQKILIWVSLGLGTVFLSKLLIHIPHFRAEWGLMLPFVLFIVSVAWMQTPSRAEAGRPWNTISKLPNLNKMKMTMVLLLGLTLLVGGGVVALGGIEQTATEVMQSGPARTLKELWWLWNAPAEAVKQDYAIYHWKLRLAENPILAVAKSIAHTLLAPYPWVALWPGLNWRSFSELYYPGMLLWIAMLPGMAFGFVRLVRQQASSIWVLILFFFVLSLVYTIVMGEWSTRQRVLGIPTLFAIGVVGWDALWQRLLGTHQRIRK